MLKSLNKTELPRTEHIPMVSNKTFVGTPRYASLNTHLGLEQSRRDDLETLGYMLIYFFKGSLPWSGLQAQSMTEKYANIREYKQCTSVEELCDGMPKEFAEYMNICRNLEFEEEPPYDKLTQMFKDC